MRLDTFVASSSYFSDYTYISFNVIELGHIDVSDGANGRNAR